MAIFDLEIDKRYLVNTDIESLALPADLPAFIAATFTPEQTYAFAFDQWSLFFNDPAFTATLTKLLTAGDLTLTLNREHLQDELAWLADLRKTGTRLSDAYKLLDASHKFPNRYKNFIRGIGQFKDNVWFNGRVEFELTDLLHMAEKVRNSVPLTFTPASQESFIEGYQSYLAEITSLAGLPELTLEQHHRLRRRVRTLKNYFLLLYRQTGDASAMNLSKLLEPVATEMGKAQNLIVNLATAGEADPATDKTVIQPRHLDIINRFLALNQLTK